MNWLIQTYTEDLGNYMVFRQGDGAWQLLFNGKMLGSYPDEQSAIAYAETLHQQSTQGSPP